MSTKPNIRFKGYIDDWEQRKLSECAGFRRGSFPQPYGNKEWYDGEEAMPFVQVADVADDMKLVDDTKQKISKLAQPMSVFADKGSVLVTLQGSIGRVAITQYGAFVDRTVLIFDRYNQDIDKTFWAYIIKEKFIDEARKAPGGTIKTITKEALSDFDLMLPCFDEQKKLGAFLVSIDNLITLHQRKCDETKTLKQYMLQKMFPQKGSVIPEIRFEGFTDDWEQRKYSEIGDCISGGSLSYNSLDDDGIYKCVLYGDLYTMYDSVIKNITRKTNEKGNTIYKNDILFPQSTTVDAYSLISPACLNEETAETSGVFVIRPYSDIDGNFIAYYTKGNNFQRNKLAQNAQGLTIVHLYWNSIKDETIMVPTFDEQKKISNFFMEIDNLITLHQRKCDDLKEVKRYMLQNIFPQRG